MECVFFNFTTNTLEAMPRGGQIRISARNIDQCVFIDVEDTGPGIPHSEGRLSGTSGSRALVSSSVFIPEL